MSSAATAFVHDTRKHSQKVHLQKVARFGSLGWIPMIQVLLNSSCTALQYKTGTNFFNRAGSRDKINDHLKNILRCICDLIWENPP